MTGQRRNGTIHAAARDAQETSPSWPETRTRELRDLMLRHLKLTGATRRRALIMMIWAVTWSLLWVWFDANQPWVLGATCFIAGVAGGFCLITYREAGRSAESTRRDLKKLDEEGA